MIQVVQGSAYREKAEGQYVHTVHDLYKRGSIYFSTKDNELVSAATVKTGFLLAIDPSKIVDADDAYNKISNVIQIDKDNFIARAHKKDKKYQEINREVENADAEKIKALKIPGVKLYQNQWRYYPGKTLSARTIGFVGFDQDTLVGKYGLERSYEDVLKRDNDHLTVNFFAELFGNLGNLVSNTDGSKQGDIVTTIEPTVERTLDRILDEAQAHWNSDLTGGIIINPRNGEIIAMSASPSFNLNDHSDTKIEDFVNPLIENVYELGSIIKPLTIASGLDAGVITLQSTYNDTGCATMDTFTFCNYDGSARGTVNVQEILSQSLNIGVAHVTELLGKDRFKKYFYGLDLGIESGIDLPNEGHGLIKNLENPRDIEFATASFGQGIALTPIAATRALSTLANGGVLVTPHIVKKIIYKNGESKDITYPEGKRVFTEQTGEDITRMLVKVVDTALKNGNVKNPYYAIAAKTGTAQIHDPVNGGYYKDKFLHSFFGYFPAYDPKFLIFLYTVEPKGVKYASETLTDPFIELTKFMINYYALPPDR